jgi:chemotaxis protein CheY-P-specific phosphatase CheC
MNEDFNIDILKKSVASTLEDTAFIFLEEEEDAQIFEGDMVFTTLSFSGIKTGKMILATEMDLSIQLAANLLGLEEDDPFAVDKGKEALSEMLNIICGVFLEMWLGSDNNVTMDVPATKIISGAEVAKEISKAIGTISFMSDEDLRIDSAVILNQME